MLITVLSNIFTPSNFLIILGGVALGIVFGAVPGLSATTGIALMLPVSFSMSDITGILFLGAIYVGGISGGLVSAILIGIPGTPASVATCFDGYPMARAGRSSRALGIGILSSFLGTIFSVIIAMLFCPIIARYAVKMGPWEMFSLCFCAIVLVVTMSKGNMFNGLMAAMLGFIISSVGIAPIDGAKRFSFGISIAKVLSLKLEIVTLTFSIPKRKEISCSSFNNFLGLTVFLIRKCKVYKYAELSVFICLECILFSKKNLLISLTISLIFKIFPPSFLDNKITFLCCYYTTINSVIYIPSALVFA